MGVQGLWPLLEPAGRRINIQALAGRRLAVDASIWIFQFMKVMRDDDGEFVHNGHLLGFFRRICRLLFNKIRPVFVFDGATPVLKKLTVAARRQRRETQGAQIRKTAEKLLMTKLKAQLLEEEKARRAIKRGAKPVGKLQHAATAPTSAPRADGASTSTAAASAQPSVESDALLAAQIDAALGTEGEGDLANVQGVGIIEDRLRQGQERGQTIQEVIRGLEDDVEVEGGDDGGALVRLRRRDQSGREGSPLFEAVADDDDPGELVDLDAVDAPVTLDAEALGRLPPSVQLEHIAKFRDQQTMANRVRFREASANPNGFSSVQIDSFLERSRFREKVDSMRDEMNRAAGFGGDSARPVASQAGKQYLLTNAATGPQTETTVKVPQAKRPSRSDWNRAIMRDVQAGRFLRGSQDAPMLETPAALAFHQPASARKSSSVPGLESTQASTRSSLPQMSSSVDAVEISVAAPSGETSAHEILAAMTGSGAVSTAGPSNEADGSGDEDEFEWEDADGSDAPAAVPTSQDKVPKDWRERAAQRHQHWSRLHGFKLGRKIGDWAKQDEAEERDAEAASPRGEREQLEREEAQVQAAILESLGQAPGAMDGGGKAPSEDAAVASGSGAGAMARHGTADAGGAAEAALPPRAEVIASSPAAYERPAAPDGARGDAAVNDSIATTSARPSAALRLPAMPAVTKPAKGSMGPPAPRVASSSLPHPSDSAMAQRAMASQDMQNSIAALRESGDFDPDLGRREPPPPTRASRKGSAASLVRQLNDSSAAAMRVAEGSAAPGDVEVAASLAGPPATVGVNATEDSPRGAATGKFGTPSPVKPQSAAQLVSTHSPFEDKRTNAAVAHTAAQAEPPGSPPAMQPSAPLAVPLPTAASAVHAPPLGNAGASMPDAEVAAGQQAGTAQIAQEALACDPAQAAHDGEEDEEEDLDLDELVDAPPEVLRELPARVQAAVEAHRKVVLAQRGSSGLLGSAALGAGAGSGLTGQLDSAAPQGGSVGAQVDGSGAEGGQAGAAAEGLTRKGGAVVKATDNFLVQAAQRHRTEESIDLDASLRSVMGEAKSLKQAFRKQAGQQDTPTDQMYRECQELLQYFGIPYIIAPAEAEAQCAWLDANGLVDGVVTDDNDAFLFGATHVYRHFFEEKQFCEQYTTAEIERDFGLSQERLALLAMLLGSDYTEGVAGIGIVNAMETLHVFPDLEGLREFREWLESPDYSTFEPIQKRASRVRANGEAAAKKGKGKGGKKGAREAAKGSAAAAEPHTEINAAAAPDHGAASDSERPAASNAAQDGEEGATEVAQSAEPTDPKEAFKLAHRKPSKNWQLPANFPSKPVLEAYLQPRVDASKDKFEFRSPDIGVLRHYCERQFGWEQEQVDSLLLPVVKSYEDRKTQLRMDAFVTMKHRFAKIRSSRLQKAVAAVAGAPLDEELVMASADGDAAASQGAAASSGASKGKRAARGKKGKKRAAEGSSDEGDGAEQGASKRANTGEVSIFARGYQYRNDPEFDPDIDGGELVDTNLAQFLS